MSKEIIVDQNRNVTITIEKGAQLLHYIEIRRKYEQNNILLDKREVLNGPQNKLTFNYSSISVVSSFVLIPRYKKDDKIIDSTLLTTYNPSINHTILNFADDNLTDDHFDLQVNFYIQ